MLITSHLHQWLRQSIRTRAQQAGRRRDGRRSEIRNVGRRQRNSIQALEDRTLLTLNVPAIQNHSFEQPAITADTGFSTNVDGWFSEANGAMLGRSVLHEGVNGGGDAPETPFGNQRLQLLSDAGTPGIVYQQISTWEPDLQIQVSMLVGNRTALSCSQNEVQLYAGGTGTAATDTPLGAGGPGATQIDTSGSQSLPADATTEFKTFVLDSGTGHSEGDALWLRLAQTGTIVNNAAVLIDNLRIPSQSATSPSSGRVDHFLKIADGTGGGLRTRSRMSTYSEVR